MNKTLRVFGKLIYWAIVLIIFGIVAFHTMGPSGIALLFVLGTMYATFLVLRLIFRGLQMVFPIMSTARSRRRRTRRTRIVDAATDDDFGGQSNSDLGISGSCLFTDPENSWFSGNIHHHDYSESTSFRHDDFGSSTFGHDSFGSSSFDNGIGGGSSSFDSGIGGSGMSGGFGSPFDNH